jgi:hypothetical protein
MTTGRINQVTIVEPAGGGELASAGDLSQMGGVETRPRPSPPNPIGGSFQRPSVCHNRILQDGVRQNVEPNRIVPHFDMAAPEGGYPPPVTSHERRLPVRGRAPKCVERSIANGQQSTEPHGCATAQSERTRLRTSPPLPIEGS